MKFSISIAHRIPAASLLITHNHAATFYLMHKPFCFFFIFYTRCRDIFFCILFFFWLLASSSSASYSSSIVVGAAVVEEKRRYFLSVFYDVVIMQRLKVMHDFI